MSRSSETGPAPLMGWVSGQSSAVPGGKRSPLQASLRRAKKSADDLIKYAEEAERKLMEDAQRIRSEWTQQAKATGNKVQAQLQKLQPIRGEDWLHSLADNEQWRARGTRARAFRRASSDSSMGGQRGEGREWDIFSALNTLSANRMGTTAGSPYLAPALDQVRDK